MKSRSTHKISRVLYILFFCIFITAVMWNSGCKKELAGDTFTGYHPEGLPQTMESGLINQDGDYLVVWLKPGKKSSDFNHWIDSVRSKDGPVTVSRACKNCDSSLKLLTGPGITTYIQGNTVSGGQTPTATTKATGEDGCVYYCINFRVKSRPAKSSWLPNYKFPGAPFTLTPVKVAVFDTGLDTVGLKKYLYKSIGPACFTGGELGWNFIKNNSNYRDDDTARHGTNVTRFITDQTGKFTSPVEILPVKTHNARGESDLFDVLCGFAYAKQRGVKIINASFGFYLPRLEVVFNLPVDPNVKLLREYVKYYLTNNKILLVAAAGNKDNINEKAAFDDHNLPYPSNPRNLDQVSFYPASLSRDTINFWNVITVTTVDTVGGAGTVSPNQNFSPNVVDIGVNADAVIGSQYLFNNPGLNGLETLEGSSFAAPIVTGKLVGNYHKIAPVLSKGSFKKYEIWNALGYPPISNNSKLLTKIKGGKVVDK